MSSTELVERADCQVEQQTPRILHVNDLVEGGAGAESYLLALAARQEARGHAIEIFGATMPLRSTRALGTWWSRSDAARMLRAVDTFKPDVVHAHNIARLSPSVLAAARKRGVRVVATLHDYRHQLVQDLPGHERRGSPLVRFVNKQKIRFVRKHLDRNCSMLLAPSSSLASLSKSWVQHAQLTQVPYPIDLPAEQLALGEQASFLFLGRLVEEKGVATLCRAMELVGPKVTLRVAGDGPLASLVAKAPRTEYLGAVDRLKIPELFTNTLALVMPSEWLENYPLSVLEAQAHGRAVIGTSVGGLPEMLEGGTAGLLVSPFNPEELASSMETLATDRALAMRLGMVGRKRVETQNAVELVDAKLLQCYGC